jgi:hypothetical protein
MQTANAGIGADGVDAQRPRPFVLVEQIGDHRLRRRRTRGFADADADPRQRQRGHALRQPAAKRHRAPERERDGDDIAPVEAVGDARDGDAEQRIEQYEAKPREQAHGGIAYGKFLFDRLDQDVEDRAIEKVQCIDDGEQPKHVISSRRRPCGCVRLYGRLRRHIDHWFSPIFRAEGAMPPG